MTIKPKFVELHIPILLATIGVLCKRPNLLCIITVIFLLG